MQNGNGVWNEADHEYLASPDWVGDQLILREVFESTDGRILGTEKTVERRGDDSSGYAWKVEITASHHFVNQDAADAWLAELETTRQEQVAL